MLGKQHAHCKCKKLPNYLRTHRKRAGLSQADVARVAGVTQPALSNYELGKRVLPLSTFLGILAALDIGAGELLDIPEIVVVRDSRLGRAVEALVAKPELADTIL